MIKSLIQRAYNFRIRERGLLNPFIHLEINSLGNYQGINCDNKRAVPIIVSVASNREDFKELPLTLYSLLNQKIKPDRLILWLDEEYEDLNNLPYEITQFIKNGLEIRFVKNFGCYTKTIYCLKEFTDAINVIASDKVYYPHDWLHKLYISYVAHPEDIHVHKAIQENIKQPYKDWRKTVENIAGYANFIQSENGILYPPNCFSKEALRKDIFLKHALDSDDVWFWTMALVHSRKIRIVKNNIKTTIYTNIFKHLKTTLHQKKQTNEANNKAIKSLLKLYGENIYNKLKKIP